MSDRPNRDDYYMGIATAVRRRASCLGSRVGAVLVLQDRVIATGYNGTPEGMPNCEAGGCDRCLNKDKYQPGEGYELCICVHAEANALLTAARFGVAVDGSTCYTTMRPCFGCAKSLLQAKVRSIRYLHAWAPRDPDHLAQYQRLLAQFPDGVHHVDLPDAESDWALSAGRRA